MLQALVNVSLSYQIVRMYGLCGFSQTTLVVRGHRLLQEAKSLLDKSFLSASQIQEMLICKPVQLASSSSRSPTGLRCRPCPEHLARRSNVVTSCSSLPRQPKERSSLAPRLVSTLNVAGDLNVFNITIGGGGQPVEWDAVAISSAAKALLQQHGVKASTALKMHRMLGLEDVDDIQHLTPDLVSQLQLKPLQLEPLLKVLRESEGRRSEHPQHSLPQTGMKLPVELRGICYVAFSGDGRRALSCNCNEVDELLVWDPTTGAITARLGEHDEDDRIWAVAIAPDGRTAVSGSRDGVLRVWDVHTNTLAPLEGHTDGVDSVAVTPDGRRAVSSSRDGTLRLWDLRACVCIATLGEHTPTLWHSVAITPDGRHAVSCGGDSLLRLWDLATHACISSMAGHGGSVYSVAITPDGRHAVSGSADNTLRIWELETHACTATLEGHTDDVNCLAITPDGRHAVSCSDDTTLRVWDLATHACIATLEGHKGCVSTVVITPDGRHAVSSADNCAPRVWDLAAALGAARAAHQY